MADLQYAIPYHCPTAEEICEMTVGEVRTVGAHFKRKLKSGELLTGTPTIVEVTTSHLTIDNKAVSSTTLTIVNESCVAGQALTCRIAASGATVGSEYTISLTCGTGGTPANTLQGFIRVQIVAG